MSEDTAIDTTPEPESPTPTPDAGFDLSVVIAQAKQVITDPSTFYGSMAKSGGYSEPLIFALVMAAAGGLVYGALSIIGLTGAGFAGLGAVIAMPIGIAIGSFIAAAILFVIWKLMGSPENYETAYRCVAYSTAVLPVVSVLMIIPYLGTVVRVVWSTWLMITASTKVHGRDFKIAAIVFGILGVLQLMSGIAGESAQRNMQEVMTKNSDQMEQNLKSLEQLGMNEDGEIDPEKAGQALGKFMKGLQEAAESAEAEQEAKK